MIQTDDQLQQAWEALGDLYRALASYRSKILPQNPRNYVVIAQAPIEEIRKIQNEIDAYLGLNGTYPAPIEKAILLREESPGENSP